MAAPRRRAFLAGLGAALLAGAAGAQSAPRIIVVSRRRVLQETRAGRTLREAEAAQTAAFQSRVEAAKRALEARESELARQRGSLPRAAFREQTDAFDRAVRATRRETQRQAAVIQTAFRDARERLAGALGPILASVLRDRGADVVLDTDSVLVARPGVDVTDEVIARFDAEVPPLEIDLAELRPLLPEDFTAAGGEANGPAADGG